MKDRFLAELRRDKKKAALLGTLTVVAAFLVGKSLLPSPTPQKVRAASSLLAQPQAISASGAQAAAQKAKAAVRSRKARKDLLLSADLSSDIKRDIFLLNPTYFPPEKAAKATTTQPATSQQGPTRDKIVQAQAGGLLLESVIMSSRPVAIINGQMRQVGQTIGEFDIVEIAATSCIVSKDGVQVQLNMRDQTPRVVGVEPESWLFDSPEQP